MAWLRRRLTELRELRRRLPGLRSASGIQVVQRARGRTRLQSARRSEHQHRSSSRRRWRWRQPRRRPREWPSRTHTRALAAPPSKRRGGDGRPRLVHERRWCCPPAEPRVGSAGAARAATPRRGSSAAPGAPATAAALSPAANRLGHTGSAAGMRPGTASRACAETSTQYRSPSRRRGSGRRRGPAGSTSPRGGGERAPPTVRGTARPTRRAPGRGEAHCRQRGGSHCRPQRRRTYWRRAKTSVASRGARR